MVAVQVSYAPNRELYDAARTHVWAQAELPTGLIVHTANEMPDGRIQIIDVYESMETLAAFGESRVLPAFASADIPPQVTESSRPTPYTAFNVVRPGKGSS